ncbi:MAG: iron-containing alcohol dehydrogenase [Pseudonocardiaceae bacterium]|nr:iron-containing alcohol dehydrogenase [Pseudonocardiaceae bacterium]
MSETAPQRQIVQIECGWNPVRVLSERGAVDMAARNARSPAVLVIGGHSRRSEFGEAANHRKRLVVPSSRWNSVLALAAELRRLRPGSVVAVGGGSVLDAAKVACGLAGLPDEPALGDLVNGTIPLRRTIELWQIPTTAGTGSEVTKWSSIWTEDGRKVSVEADALYADVAVLDPALTASMDARLTAATGLDALGHAVESIWSRNHRPETDRLACHALGLIARHLPDAVSGPTARHRTGMSSAALHAGLALSWCRSTAPHALSYPFTGVLGIEHGLAVGLMLLAVLEPTERIAPQRVELAANALRISGSSGSRGIAAFVKDIFSRAGLTARLGGFGVTPEFVDQTVAAAAAQPRFANHPDGLDMDEVRGALLRLV